MFTCCEQLNRRDWLLIDRFGAADLICCSLIAFRIEKQQENERKYQLH